MRVEPRVGVEPTTCRLRIDCSTTELPRPSPVFRDFFRNLDDLPDDRPPEIARYEPQFVQ
jgi:hypothetical protein